MQIIFDIFETYIFDYLDIKSQMRLRSTDKQYQNLKIINLLHIGKKYKYKLNGYVIRQYPHLKYLYAGSRTNIYNADLKQISQTVNLEELHAGYDLV